MAVQKKGQQSAQQKNDISFIPGVGLRTIIRREFMSYDAAVAFAATNFHSGLRADVRQKGDAPIWTVEAQLEGDPTNPEGDLQNTHELRVNVLNPDIKSSLRLQSRFTPGTAFAAISAVEKLANDIKDGDKTYAEAIQAIADSTSIEDADIIAAAKFLDLLIAGVETFTRFQFVYVHTFNFGTARDLALDLSNVNEIHSTGHVRSDEGTPNILELPPGEWLKLAPEKTVMYGGRALIKYEYWWAEQWSEMLYAHAG